ncbi:hypothetical protein [Shewanella algae]|uniref:hypothetical protein n=1 Tax=Shewanella algae TaxID=38313 RepID=UPI001AAD0CA7|nr:hypothetical protein [Shewanella algae]MBO2579666.1 hypothetical protein [Shewanella algae]MBO2685279.1 hypothetical protein [Shewanella algae]BCV63827.1 hypothetical protein TUM17386_34980 [Shewanella algae]
MYKKLLDFWIKVSSELNLDIDIGHKVTLDSGEVIESLLLVKGFGAKIGMLIFSKDIDITQVRKELNELGYGYSHMYPPLENEQFDIDDYVELLEDWGGTGKLSEKFNYAK